MTSSSASFVLRGGLLIDGTGAPPRQADVAVAEGRIVDVATAAGAAGGREIDVTGLVVTPGFIDIHTHCDFTLPAHPRADSMIRQGVTTVVTGNCGHSTFPAGAGERLELLRRYSAFLGKDLDWSWSDAAGYTRMLSALPLAVNVALLVGHGTARVAAMGFESRPPSERELAQMCAAVDDAMRAGAFGLSSGLIYAPGSYAATGEIVALARSAAAAGGFYATHMRNEGAALLTAVGEAIDVAQRAGLPLHISHHKVLGRRNWGLTRASLELLDSARRSGSDITLDQYPYQASSTTLTVMLPGWAMEGGVGQMRARLASPAEREKIRTQILNGPADGSLQRDFEPDTIVIASVPGGGRELTGHNLADLAADRAMAPVDVLLGLLAEHGGGVEVVLFGIGEDDIHRVMRHPQVAVASDGWTLHPDAGGRPHPRSYGTFARVLGHYVREEGVLSLPAAVRKMTCLPAGRLGLADRGVVRTGAVADLTVFDPATVTDRATFTNPHQFCTGVEHVFVNGVQVIEGAADTGRPAGQVLRGPGAPR
ncbi:MAG: N-acyl-D-amino-acid deacylase family protein [Streptosporangiaceae bacterium]